MTPDTRFVHQIRAVARPSEMDAGAAGFGIPVYVKSTSVPKWELRK